jgi:hypothetical protein
VNLNFQPSLDELTTHGYLEMWRIEKTTDRKAYKVILFHGPKFHRDRRKRLEQKGTTEPPVVIAESQSAEPNLPEPGRVERATATITSHSARPQKKGRTEIGSFADDVATGTQAVQLLIADDPQLKPSEIDTSPTILDELVARGLMASAATNLLNGLPPECI